MTQRQMSRNKATLKPQSANDKVDDAKTNETRKSDI